MSQRSKIHFLKIFFIASFFSACQSQSGIPVDLTVTVPAIPLTAVEVSSVTQATAEALSDETQAIAVVDRIGNPLAIYSKSLTTNADLEIALAKARTGAFFSNDQAPLSTRTVSYISREHFPPGIDNTPSGALFGIEHTNRGCSLNVVYSAGKNLPSATTILGATPGLGINVTPGGVPLYKGGRLVGGVGVAGVSDEASEFAAVSGEALFAPTPAAPGVIFIDGISLPFADQTTIPSGSSAGMFNGAFVAGPVDGMADPTGDLIAVIDSPTLDNPKLSALDVQTILDQAVARADVTRAAIRLPLGQRAKMAIAVSDLAGNILGLFRMTDSTIFSVDVAVAKARNVTYFSGSSVDVLDQIPGVPLGTATTNRTLGFLAQPFYPPGIKGTGVGALRDLYLYDEANACTQGRQAVNANQNGIVFFPGSSPLYKDDGLGGRVLVGGVGVSGDGVEQDDYVTDAALVGYEPPDDIRADQYFVDDVRLPYFKFPRNPEN